MTSRAFDLVTRLHGAARTSGASVGVEQFENIATQSQYRIAYSTASRNVAAGDRVLDWGCGNGHFSFFLDSLGARVTGFSFEPRPRALAGSRTFEFVQGGEHDPRSLPFLDATFDAVVGVGVLEHVGETGGDERASLAELARVVRPGGAFLTYHLPNAGGWIERLVHAVRPNAYVHPRRYTEREIRELWAAAGFGVVEMGLYNALPRRQLKHLPAAIRHSRVFARLYDLADDSIAALAPSVCTNFYVVARRNVGEPAAPRQ